MNTKSKFGGKRCDFFTVQDNKDQYTNATHKEKQERE